MGLDQTLATHHLGEDNLCRTTRYRVHRTEQQSHPIEPRHREMTEPGRQGNAGRCESDERLTRQVHRELAHPV